MLIDHSFFTGTLSIPGGEQIPVRDAVDAYIEENELAFLQMAIGGTAAEALLAAVAATGSDEEVEARWQDLLTGKTYTTPHSRTYTFEGLERDLARYTLFGYSRWAAAPLTSLGATRPAVENSNIVPLVVATERFHNDMVKDLYYLRDYLARNATVYPEYKSSEVSRSSLETINWAGI